MRVKSNHRSKLSNFSNWKEEAWKVTGLQRDSNLWSPRYRCDARPAELWSHILRAKSILLSSHLPMQWNDVKCIFHIYFTSFHCTGRYELNKLTLLPMCGFTAQLVEHRTGVAEVTGSNSVEALIFFRLIFQALIFTFQLLKLENLLRFSLFTFISLVLNMSLKSLNS